MQTIKQSIANHIKAGRGKETANRLAYIDCCYGRAKYSDIVPKLSTECRHCSSEILEDDVKIQAPYWDCGSHFYQLWHKDCHEKHHKVEVIEQQTIDMDCNECISFEATQQTDKYGDRHGVCKKTGLQTTAHPGGVFCNYPSHDECFEHRKAHLIRN